MTVAIVIVVCSKSTIVSRRRSSSLVSKASATIDRHQIETRARTRSNTINTINEHTSRRSRNEWYRKNGESESGDDAATRVGGPTIHRDDGVRVVNSSDDDHDDDADALSGRAARRRARKVERRWRARICDSVLSAATTHDHDADDHDHDDNNEDDDEDDADGDASRPTDRRLFREHPTSGDQRQCGGRSLAVARSPRAPARRPARPTVERTHEHEGARATPVDERRQARRDASDARASGRCASSPPTAVVARRRHSLLPTVGSNAPPTAAVALSPLARVHFLRRRSSILSKRRSNYFFSRSPLLMHVRSAVRSLASSRRVVIPL